MTSEIRRLAMDVDDVIAALEQTVDAYVSAALRVNAEHILSRNQPHPVLERAPDYVRVAIGSRINLAKYLGISPTNPPISVASQHPE